MNHMSNCVKCRARAKTRERMSRAVSRIGVLARAGAAAPQGGDWVLDARRNLARMRKLFLGICDDMDKI
jgi:hypothetical protein